MTRTAAAAAGAVAFRAAAGAAESEGEAGLPPNRIATSTYSFWRFKDGLKLRIEDCIDKAAGYGFDGVDILHMQMHREDDSYLQGLKRHALVNGIALCGLSIHQGFVFPDKEVKPGGEVNLRAEKQLRKYLDGKLRHFDLKVDMLGTPFQRKVLKKVSAIPFGKTMTYGDIARAVGSPGGARAVGRANATNLLPLVIPCHRVVASDGLGGYGGGLNMKSELLKLEGTL